jgi:6-phosphogluconolactonase
LRTVVHIVQVDERVAPAADPDRNLTHIRETLIDQAPVRPENLHPMPVESSDLAEAAREYAGTLAVIAGTPPEIDLVHLGLGPDGHAASLVPADPVNQVTDRDVALTGVYQGRCRMTLTYPAINRARRVLWLVTGAENAEMLPRLWKADASIPAGRVRQERAVIVANRAAVDRA